MCDQKGAQKAKQGKLREMCQFANEFMNFLKNAFLLDGGTLVKVGLYHVHNYVGDLSASVSRLGSVLCGHAKNHSHIGQNTDGEQDCNQGVQDTSAARICNGRYRAIKKAHTGPFRTIRTDHSAFNLTSHYITKRPFCQASPTRAPPADPTKNEQMNKKRKNANIPTKALEKNVVLWYDIS